MDEHERTALADWDAYEGDQAGYENTIDHLTLLAAEQQGKPGCVHWWSELVGGDACVVEVDTGCHMRSFATRRCVECGRHETSGRDMEWDGWPDCAVVVDDHSRCCGETPCAPDWGDAPTDEKVAPPCGSPCRAARCRDLSARLALSGSWPGGYRPRRGVHVQPLHASVRSLLPCGDTRQDRRL